MHDILIFIFKYLWLFTSLPILVIGDTLFIIRSILDFNETMRAYKEENKDKSFLKGKFTAQIICLACNIVLILSAASFIFYTNEVAEMRNMISNL